MRKLLCISVSILMLLAMTACGGKEQTVVLTFNQDGVEMEFQMDAKGDIVQTITQTSVLDCSAYEQEQIDAIIESTEEYSATYEEYDGVTYTVTTEGTDIIEKIVIDTTDSDNLEELSEAQLLPIDGSAEKISVKKTVEALEAEGWVVK